MRRWTLVCASSIPRRCTGEAERVLADALGTRRSDALVATKVWTTSVADGLRQVQKALHRFGGRLDLYQIHNLVNWRGHLPELERIRDTGAIAAIARHSLQPVGIRRTDTGDDVRSHYGNPDPVQPARTRGRTDRPAAGKRPRARCGRNAPIRRRAPPADAAASVALGRLSAFGSHVGAGAAEVEPK